VVQTADGLPIHHEVFAGNTAETPTWLPTLETVLAKFPSIKRVVLVADRGLLSLDNLDALSAVRLKSGAPLEFVLAVPGRRYGEFAEVLGDFQRDHCAKAKKEITGELVWQDRRLIVAHDPERAGETHTLRRERLATLETQAAAWSGKLDAQDNGARARGRKLSDSGTKARFYHAVKEARLAHIVKVDLKGDLFAWHIDPDALALAELMDGKRLLVTNVKDLKPVDVVARYKSLADIERGFRILKSEIEIGPVFHRLPTRIRAHASLCFMALILYRVMRQRLKASGSELLGAMGVARSYSRPRVSNDNPFSESHFKTLKYTPDYPGRFEDAEQARQWVRRFVPYYNERPHEGLALFTPADVFHGRVDAVAAIRHQALNEHYARYVNGAPTVALSPTSTSTLISPWMHSNYWTPPVHYASSPPRSTPAYPKLLHRNLAPGVGKVLTRSVANGAVKGAATVCKALRPLDLSESDAVFSLCGQRRCSHRLLTILFIKHIKSLKYLYKLYEECYPTELDNYSCGYKISYASY
jgi:hypothetical protein